LEKKQINAVARAGQESATWLQKSCNT